MIGMLPVNIQSFTRVISTAALLLGLCIQDNKSI